MVSVIGSTNTCEQASSFMKKNELKLHSRGKDVHLLVNDKIEFTFKKWNQFLSKSRPNFRFRKVSVSLFLYDVNCVLAMTEIFKCSFIIAHYTK